jgi:hypothetical protein
MHFYKALVIFPLVPVKKYCVKAFEAISSYLIDFPA